MDLIFIDASALPPPESVRVEARMRERAVQAVMGGTPWLTAAEVGRRRRSDTSNPHAAVSRWNTEVPASTPATPSTNWANPCRHCAARWLHDELPSAHGLFWMSRRDNEYACLMLFGDRLASLPPIRPVSMQPIAE